MTRTALKITVICLSLIFLMAAPVLAKGGNGNGQGGQGSGTGQGGQGNGTGSWADFPYEELSTAETASLELMIQDEKLARDVYAYLGETWALGIFAQIGRSEQRHLDTIVYLFDKYEMDASAAQAEPGVFTDAGVQTLYNNLVEAGSASLTAALEVGVHIEELDIYDLQQALIDADNQDVRTAFQNLLKGSRNHLRSFYAQLLSNGGTYEAQYLSEEEFTLIVESSMERGRVDENGDPVSGSGGGQHGGGNGGGGNGGNCPNI